MDRRTCTWIERISRIDVFANDVLMGERDKVFGVE